MNFYTYKNGEKIIIYRTEASEILGVDEIDALCFAGEEMLCGFLRAGGSVELHSNAGEIVGIEW